MIFGKHNKKFKAVWAVVSVFVAIGMILLYAAPLFTN
jgi:hypothetical protein